jgi:hypothetical protein
MSPKELNVNTLVKSALSGAMMIGLMAVSAPSLAEPPAAASKAKSNAASKTAPNAASSLAVPKSVKDKMVKGLARPAPNSSALSTQECEGLGGKVIWDTKCQATPFRCIRENQHGVLFEACITELPPD